MEHGPSWKSDSSSDSQEIPAIYRTWRFITVIITARHRSLSWARWIQSTPSYRTSLRSISIISLHLCLGITKRLSPSDFPNKHFVSISHLPCVPHSPPISCILFDHPNSIWRIVRIVQIMALIITQFSPASCHFTPLTLSCCSQYPFLEHHKFVPPLRWTTKFHTHTIHHTIVLMMKAASTSETSVNFYHTTWRDTRLRENLKSHVYYFVPYN
jgi:hypothetical protein